MVRRDRGPCPRSKIYLEESSYAKRTRTFVGEDRALCKFRKGCVGDPAPLKAVCIYTNFPRMEKARTWRQENKYPASFDIQDRRYHTTTHYY